MKFSSVFAFVSVSAVAFASSSPAAVDSSSIEQRSSDTGDLSPRGLLGGDPVGFLSGVLTDTASTLGLSLGDLVLTLQKQAPLLGGLADGAKAAGTDPKKHIDNLDQYLSNTVGVTDKTTNRIVQVLGLYLGKTLVDTTQRIGLLTNYGSQVPSSPNPGGVLRTKVAPVDQQANGKGRNKVKPTKRERRAQRLVV